MRPISFPVSGMGPQIARQTLVTKRNATNRNRMLFCQQKMRHRARCRRRPLEQSFGIATKLQALSSNIQRNPKFQAPNPKKSQIKNRKSQKRFRCPRAIWNLELGVSLELGAWDLALVVAGPPAQPKAGYCF